MKGTRWQNQEGNWGNTVTEEKQERRLTSESSLRVNDITGSASFEHGFASGRSFILSSMNSRSFPFHRILETPRPLPPDRFCDLQRRGRVDWWPGSASQLTSLITSSSWFTGQDQLHKVTYSKIFHCHVALLCSNLERTEVAGNGGWLIIN